MLRKQEFIREIESSLGDVRDKQDCIDWWSAHIDAYIEDGTITKLAINWTNPFIKQFEE